MWKIVKDRQNKTVLNIVLQLRQGKSPANQNFTVLNLSRLKKT